MSSRTRTEIIEGMATALWMYACEGRGRPQPEELIYAATDLADLYEAANDKLLDEMFDEIRRRPGSELEFGEQLAKIALGKSGVSGPRVFGREIVPVTFRCSLNGDTLSWTGVEGKENPAGGPRRAGERSRFRETQRGHGRTTAVRPRPLPGITYCGICKKPAHASETNDAGEHPDCARRALAMPAGGYDSGQIGITGGKRARRKNPSPVKVGDFVVIVAPDDDTDAMHTGVATRVDGEWITVRIDGESTVSEWPVERVLFDPYRKNPHELRYPLVCKKCKRAIREADLGRIGVVYKDTHESERCPSGGEHAPYGKNPGTFTVYKQNRMLGTAGYEGTFETQEEAQAHADLRAARSRKFASYQVWTGTPQKPGKPVGLEIHGVS